MADITTATVSNGDLKTWDIPPLALQSIVPRGEVLFQGSQVIPAKLAADQSLWTLQCNFPRNFVYRLVEVRFWAVTDDSTVYDSFSTSITGLVSTDAPDEDAWYFMCPGQTGTSLNALSAVFNIITFLFSSAAQSFIGFYRPVEPVNAPIDVGSGAGRLFFRWADITNDATDPVTVFFRIRALMYTVEQARSWQMHTPSPVITP